MSEVFKYYKLCPSEEHYLFAKELCKRIGIYSKKNKPHVKFFTDVYDFLSRDLGEEKLYYHTKNGMVRVFPNQEIIHKVIKAINPDIPQGVFFDLMMPETYYVNDVKYEVVIDSAKYITVSRLLNGKMSDVI